MLISQLLRLDSYRHVQALFVQLIDMQFSDVRAMLQLPRPDIGISAGCNFAIVSTLCNLLSGISTILYKPANLLHEVRSKCQTGTAFQGLVRDFFPYSPPGSQNLPKELYDYARNPLAHSAGLNKPEVPFVSFSRVFDPAHPDSGRTDEELNNLERGLYRVGLPGIKVNGAEWTLHLDSFYIDVIDLLRGVTADASQMQAAEGRFQQGVFNWRQ